MSFNILDNILTHLGGTAQATPAGDSLIQLLNQPYGYASFLHTVGRNTFTKEFASYHEQFWDWYWRLTAMRKAGIPLTSEQLTFLALWARSCGKSANIEWACITEGAMGLEGYVLYVCHELGTNILDPDSGKWMKVEEHPTAKLRRCGGLEVKLFGTPFPETVTPEHRYFARKVTRKRVTLRKNGVRSSKTEVSVSRPDWCEAKDITTDHFVGYPINQVQNPVPEIAGVSRSLMEDPDWWWFLGLWWGDGTLSRNQVSVYVGNSDKGVLPRLTELLLKHGISFGVCDRAGCKQVSFSNKHLADWLRTWKAGDCCKLPPDWVEFMSKDLQRQLLNGYVDSDGYEEERCVSITSVYKEGLMFARRVLIGLGVPASVTKVRESGVCVIEGREMKSREAYRLRIGQGAELLGYRVDFKDSYPYNKFFVADGFVWYKVRSTAQSGERVFVPISTSTETYITDYGLSHNCSTQSSANSHVADIRRRLESDDVATYFPHLSDPEIGKHGNRYGWRQDFLITKGGWAIRPVGLDVAVRGLREEDLRPTMIVFDDIDSYDMTPQATEENLRRIARNILPSGTANTIQLVAQNLIAEHCAVNQIYTGKTDILTDHEASWYPAFKPETLRIHTHIDNVTGKTTHTIDPDSEPTWSGFSVEEAQQALNKSGLEAFMAEYQHDFSFDKSDKVIPEYLDYPTHVISWSQFEEKFGTRYHVPTHWQIGVGLDIGYTAEHLSAWSWIAVGAEDSGLPNARFRYRGLTFTGESINDQAEKVLNTIKFPIEGGRKIHDERDQYLVCKMSHEKKGERLVLNREYRFTFSECSFRSEDGIPEWRNLLRVDKSQPHPFHEDRLLTEEECQRQKLPLGSYHLGRPNFFDVVEDDQIQIPRNDMGLAIHRAQTVNWKRRKVVMTATGIVEAKPMKDEDDANDSTRMILAEDCMSATPLTARQEQINALIAAVGKENLVIPKGNADYNGILMGRQMIIREQEMKRDEETSRIAKIISKLVITPPSFGRGRHKKKRRLMP